MEGLREEGVDSEIEGRKIKARIKGEREWKMVKEERYKDNEERTQKEGRKYGRTR